MEDTGGGSQRGQFCLDEQFQALMFHKLISFAVLFNFVFCMPVFSQRKFFWLRIFPFEEGGRHFPDQNDCLQVN